MDYWLEIIRRYLSYSFIRYALAALGAITFIVIILIIDRTRRRIRLKRMAARIRADKRACH